MWYSTVVALTFALSCVRFAMGPDESTSRRTCAMELLLCASAGENFEIPSRCWEAPLAVAVALLLGQVGMGKQGAVVPLPFEPLVGSEQTHRIICAG